MKKYIIEKVIKSCDFIIENILKGEFETRDNYKEQKIIKSFNQNKTDIGKVRESLLNVVTRNALILLVSIIVISLFVTIGVLLLNSFTILIIIIGMMLFTLIKVFKLVQNETNCKNSS